MEKPEIIWKLDLEGFCLDFQNFLYPKGLKSQLVLERRIGSVWNLCAWKRYDAFSIGHGFRVFGRICCFASCRQGKRAFCTYRILLRIFSLICFLEQFQKVCSPLYYSRNRPLCHSCTWCMVFFSILDYGGRLSGQREIMARTIKMRE